MTLNVSETLNGTQTNVYESLTYRVLGEPTIHSIPFFKVNFSSVMVMPAQSVTMKQSIIGWVAPNGTMPIVESQSNGYPVNYTGSEAQLMSLEVVSPLLVEEPTSQEQTSLTNMNAFHMVNTTEVRLGNNTFQVYYYAPNQLPFNFCGTSETFTAFLVGLTSEGGNYNFVTYAAIDEVSAGSSVSVVFRLTSITPA